MGDQPKRHLTTKEAAERYRTSEWQLNSLARRGDIPSFKFGRRRLFRLEDLEEWERQQIEAEARKDGES